MKRLTLGTCASREGSNELFMVVSPLHARKTRARGTVHKAKARILTVFGTRPEIIKLAPVIRALERNQPALQTVNITTAQHTDLLYPFVRLLGVRLDHDLKLMQPDQTPLEFTSRALATLDRVLAREKADLILVQGDTMTALVGALAGFHHRVPVGHVEAGLRTDDPRCPFPEEMNRRLITRLATYHFAATERNRAQLLGEGVATANIFVTGNPVVDSLQAILRCTQLSPAVDQVVRDTEGLKRIILTTHRRESFGEVLVANLRVLRDFVESHEDVALLFPVHPNPNVREAVTALLAGRPRIHLLEPLAYGDFVGLMARAWLLVSDSGGIQEEAPSLGKPLLILRSATERPEAVECGSAQLVGDCPGTLRRLLDEHYPRPIQTNGSLVANPFGQGDSGERIARVIGQVCARTVGGGKEAGRT